MIIHHSSAKKLEKVFLKEILNLIQKFIKITFYYIRNIFDALYFIDDDKIFRLNKIN